MGLTAAGSCLKEIEKKIGIHSMQDWTATTRNKSYRKKKPKKIKV